MRQRSRTTLALAAGLWAASLGAAEPGVEQTIIQLEKGWSAAFLRHDTAAIAGILADDFVGFDGRGVRSSKADELAEAASDGGGAPILGETQDDFQVRLYGDVAVLTDRNAVRMRLEGKEQTLRYRRTTVWARRAGRWQCVSFHASRLQEPS